VLVRVSIRNIKMPNKKSKGSQNKIIIGGRFGGVVCNCPFLCVDFSVFRGAGGGGSVRRRNTLHVVGGRQFLSQARFTGREKKEKENKIF
jgi:hypothetical protein